MTLQALSAQRRASLSAYREDAALMMTMSAAATPSACRKRVKMRFIGAATHLAANDKRRRFACRTLLALQRAAIFSDSHLADADAATLSAGTPSAARTFPPPLRHFYSRCREFL